VFDNNGNFLRKIEHWRDIGDPPLIEVSQQQAESIAEIYSQEDATGSWLVLMDPEPSRVSVYGLDSPTVNPCWVVHTSSFHWDGAIVVDAVTSDIVGRGQIYANQ
jgi:hypothetical protein